MFTLYLIFFKLSNMEINLIIIKNIQSLNNLPAPSAMPMPSKCSAHVACLLTEALICRFLGKTTKYTRNATHLHHLVNSWWHFYQQLLFILKIFALITKSGWKPLRMHIMYLLKIRSGYFSHKIMLIVQKYIPNLMVIKVYVRLWFKKHKQT